MTDNPFQSPPATPKKGKGVLSGKREDVLKVAKYQKGILICILINFIVFVSNFVLPPMISQFLGLILLATGVVSAVFVFSLAIKTSGTGLGIFLGLLSLIPLIGLLVLLMVNGNATKILKENGIQVGLLGANLSKI
ncbi:MAG: hypothetical protein AAF939_10405 [Planctomycetota bacterium]